MWGEEWKGRSICYQCDDAAVAAIMKSGWSKNALVMQLLRSLFFLAAKGGILLSGAGREYGLADILSCNSLGLFLSQVSFAQQEQ